MRSSTLTYLRRNWRLYRAPVAWIVVWLGLLVGIWFGINQLGKALAPEIKHHEMEHAHCYSANKMFFVSIACVPKE